MSECTEPRLAGRAYGRAGEGQEGMSKVGTV
jgi:hypothetical protein